jgi:hypothetical protein
MVLIKSRHQFPICYDCQKDELGGEIKNPKMKKMFDIPEQFYRDEPFLRSIKMNYLKYGKLSERQIGCFREVVEKLKKKK